MKKIRLYASILLLLAFLAGGGVFAKNFIELRYEQTVWPVNYKIFRVDNKRSEDVDLKTPAILPHPDPDLYSIKNMLSKIPPVRQGAVKIIPMRDNPGFDKFTEIRRQKEFSLLQKKTNPVALIISSGVYDMESLYESVKDPNILTYEQGVYLLRVPLYVAPGAALIMRGNPDSRLTLHLSSVTGGFIVNAGLLFIVDADLHGWDDVRNISTPYESPEKFRPFLAAWSGSETYLGRSSFYDFGYAASKSYGVSYSSSTKFIKLNPDIPPPKGWIVKCRFERAYYGFYSYEAHDVAIVDNVYDDNIVYGIDPHDRSSRLLIARNKAFNTRQKHGIIVSRDVNDSWIINNISHDNHGSGFMLDRTSVRNLVSGNIAYRNGSDGLTLFESGNNIIRNNLFILNGRSGFRMRNSSNVVASHNAIFFNKGVGVQVYAFDITKTELDRDFVMDPFTEHASLEMNNSYLLLNTGGLFKLNNIDLVRFSDIHFPWFNRKMIRGDLDDIGYDIAAGLRQKPNYIEVRKVADTAGPETPEQERD